MGLRRHAPQRLQRRRHCSRALLSLLACGSFLSLLAAATAAAQTTDAARHERVHNSVRLTEEHYRFNTQQDDLLVFTSHDSVGGAGGSALEADCATGRFGAMERWKIWFVDSDAQLFRTHANAPEPLVVYANDARQVRLRDPPCSAMVDKLRAYMSQRSFRKQAVVMETLVRSRGHSAVAVTSEPATARWVVLDGISIPMVPRREQEREMEEKQQQKRSVAHGNGAETHSQTQSSSDQSAAGASFTFAFASALDTLEAVTARDSYPVLADETRKAYVDEFFGSTDTAADLEELRRDHMELLLQEERELSSSREEDMEVSWSSARSLDDWEALRRQSPAADRKALADGWTTMAKLWLASSGNFSMSVNCLRRAVAWYPGFVPAYLELSSLLVKHVDDQNASCQAMEKMLESIDPTEFRSSGEMSSILTTHFPHCSVIIRMANLWETNTLFRYVVSASVIISFLHGLCVALYFFHDKLDACCCCWRRWRSNKNASSPSPASVSAAATRQSEHIGGKGGGRKAKRE